MLFNLLRLILILLVIRAVWQLIKGVLQGAGYRRVSGSEPPASVQLMRDPICGIYVPAGRALIARSGGQTIYFCSEKCRDEWGRR